MRATALLLIGALAACTRYYPPTPATPRDGTGVIASFGRTWDAVIDEFAAKNIPIRTLERASGFIATEALGVAPDFGTYRRRLRDTRADCGYNSGSTSLPITPTHATYNIVVRGDSGRSLVRVTVKWMRIVTGPGASLTCETSGTWETALEDGIRERAEARTRAEQPRNAAPPPAASAPSGLTSMRPTDPTPAPRMNVVLRMRFVDPDSTVTPIPDMAVAIIGERGDTTEVRTNALGVATFALPAGRYRAVPVNRADFEGKRYTWDVAFTVRMGIGPVDLTQRNARATTLPSR
jgi:hypothetical protein